MAQTAWVLHRNRNDECEEPLKNLPSIYSTPLFRGRKLSYNYLCSLCAFIIIIFIISNCNILKQKNQSTWRILKRKNKVIRNLRIASLKTAMYSETFPFFSWKIIPKLREWETIMQIPYLLKIGNSEILDLQINVMVPKSVNIEQKRTCRMK